MKTRTTLIKSLFDQERAEENKAIYDAVCRMRQSAHDCNCKHERKTFAITSVQSVILAQWLLSIMRKSWVVEKTNKSVTFVAPTCVLRVIEELERDLHEINERFKAIYLRRRQKIEDWFVVDVDDFLCMAAEPEEKRFVDAIMNWLFSTTHDESHDFQLVREAAWSLLMAHGGRLNLSIVKGICKMLECEEHERTGLAL